MNRKFTLLLIFMVAVMGNLAFSQTTKTPLIMKSFQLKFDTKVYRLPRESSQVIANKKGRSKILVVREKNQDWMMVQIGGVNSYIRKENLETDTLAYEPYVISCPNIAMHLPGRIVPTGYRYRQILLMSNRDFRNLDMNSWILRTTF